MKIYNGYKRLNENYTLMSDAYEFTMADTYLKTDMKDKEAVFDVFFRKVPNNGGYAIMAGLDKVIEYVKNLKFGDRELEYFRSCGYSEDFINYLKDFKFSGDIYAIPDGTPVFPNEPIITVKAPLIEAQIMETALLSIVNGAMEHATGARRIIEATPSNVGVMEFGSRRADGLEAAIDASIYGIMAGCVGTSNIHAANMLGKKALGTMAHSFIESYPDELTAFMEYAKNYPDNCILLVDTYDTLKSGVPNAIKTFKYLKDNNIKASIGVRLDSGDLAYLSKMTRKMLDEAGFTDAKIVLSNGLTADAIESLVVQGAKFDSLGVGDNISKPEGRMGCVYKEVAMNENGALVPKIKISADIIKITNPGYKKVYRAYDKKTNYAIADILASFDEKLHTTDLVIINPSNTLESKTINDFYLEDLQKPIFKNGNLVYDDPSIDEKRNYCNKCMMRMYEEIRRTTMPHKYHVSATEDYMKLKQDTITRTRKMMDK